MSAAITKPEDLSGRNFIRVLEALSNQSVAEEAKAGVEDRREKYRSLFAVAPADEYLQLGLLLDAYAGSGRRDYEVFESHDWSLRDECCDIDRLSAAGDPGEFFGSYNACLTLLTGVERIGADEHSDGCLVALWPADDSHPAFVYNHEIGTIESQRSASVTALFADVFGVGPESDPDLEDQDVPEDDFPEFLGESREAVAAHIAAFEKSRRKSAKSRSFFRDPIKLFQRSHWVLEHLNGEATFNFAAYLSDAPTMREWEAERKLIAREFAIANYWLLHHFYLGNQSALAQTLAIVREAQNGGPGRLTRFLAAAIEAYLKGDGPLLGTARATVDELIALTRRNAGLELFEESERAKIKSERGETGLRRLSDAEFQKIAKDHEALWAALEEYPADVAAHDRILKALSATAGQNQGLKTAIQDYFDERHADAFNDWPAAWQLKRGYKLDSRLSTPIAAVFTAGLNFSSEHERACCGITRALGVLDDDRAMAAFSEAVERLEPNDERAEYVFAALRNSRHSRAPELIERAAWRFFENLQTAIRQEEGLAAKREKEGLNLNTMWGVENFFHVPLQLRLQQSDAGAEKLARAIFDLESHAHFFQKNFGRAMRVFGERDIVDYNERILAFIETRRAAKVDEWTEIGLNEMCNLAEAGIALAKLDPDRARALLPDWFATEFASREYELGLKAALLGALFVLAKADSSGLKIDVSGLVGWLERLLGNRDNHERLAPALRAAEVAALPESFVWVRHHLYSDTNRFMRYHEYIKELAFVAAAATGQAEVPPFDDSDSFGLGLKGDALLKALHQPRKYHIESVLKAIRKTKFQHPEAITGIRDALVDILRFSADESGRTFDGYWAAWKAMAVQGRPAQSALQAVLELEYCEPGLKNDTIFLMRLLDSEAEVMSWLFSQTLEQLLAALTGPGPRELAFMDFVAARAWMLDAAGARPAIETALRRQAAWPGGHFARENPLLSRLAMVYARYGEPSQELLEELQSALNGNSDYGVDTSRDQLEHAIERCGLLKFSPTGDPPAKTKLKWNDRGRLELHRDKEHALHLRFATDYGSFSGAFEDDEHRSESSLSFADKSAAAARAGEIVDLCVILGYTAPTPPKKKASKKTKTNNRNSD